MEITATIGITTTMIMPITIPNIVFITFGFVSRATAIFFSAAPIVADIVSPPEMQKRLTLVKKINRFIYSFTIFSHG